MEIPVNQKIKFHEEYIMISNFSAYSFCIFLPSKNLMIQNEELYEDIVKNCKNLLGFKFGEYNGWHDFKFNFEVYGILTRELSYGNSPYPLFDPHCIMSNMSIVYKKDLHAKV